MKGVYLLHFNKPLSHARHYIGYAENISERVRKHKNGNGSQIMKAVKANNITFEVARTWKDGDRKLERALKNYKKSSKFCPICKGAGKD